MLSPNGRYTSQIYLYITESKQIKTNDVKYFDYLL